MTNSKENFLSQPFISTLESGMLDFDFGKIEEMRTSMVRKLMTEEEKLTIIDALSKEETIQGLITALTKAYKGETINSEDIDFINLLRYPSILNKMADIIGRKDIWDKRIIGTGGIIVPKEELGKYDNLVHPTHMRKNLKKIYGKYKYSRSVKKQ